MRSKLYVNFRQCEVPFQLDVIVDALAAGLGRQFAQLTSCTVTVDLRHRAYGSARRFDVVVELPMPEQSMSVRVSAQGKPGDGLPGLLQVAFALAAQELHRCAATSPPWQDEPLETPTRRPGPLRVGGRRALPVRVAARRHLGRRPPLGPTGVQTELSR